MDDRARGGGAGDDDGGAGAARGRSQRGVRVGGAPRSEQLSFTSPPRSRAISAIVDPELPRRRRHALRDGRETPEELAPGLRRGGVRGGAARRPRRPGRGTPGTSALMNESRRAAMTRRAAGAARRTDAAGRRSMNDGRRVVARGLDALFSGIRPRATTSSSTGDFGPDAERCAAPTHWRRDWSSRHRFDAPGHTPRRVLFRDVPGDVGEDGDAIGDDARNARSRARGARRRARARADAPVSGGGWARRRRRARSPLLPSPRGVASPLPRPRAGDTPGEGADFAANGARGLGERGAPSVRRRVLGARIRRRRRSFDSPGPCGRTSAVGRGGHESMHARSQIDDALDATTDPNACLFGFVFLCGLAVFAFLFGPRDPRATITGEDDETAGADSSRRARLHRRSHRQSRD